MSEQYYCENCGHLPSNHDLSSEYPTVTKGCGALDAAGDICNCTSYVANKRRPVKKEKIKSIDKKPTDEQNEKNLSILERYFIGTDESGHHYVVPIYRKIEFDEWSEADTEAEDFSPDLFNEFRLEGGLLTFTDPKVN